MQEFNQEVIDKLSAPVPTEQIKQKGQYGIRYTTDKWVQNRLDSAVGADGWSVAYTTVAYGSPIEAKVNKQGDTKLLLGTITCDLTVLGITKSAVADIELPNEVMRGTPATSAQARVFKRAAMLFGVARELWPEAVEDDDTPVQPQRPTLVRTQPAPRVQTRQQEPAKPVVSERQRDLLLELHVPSDLIDMLTKKDLMSADYNGKDLIGILKRKKPADQQSAEQIVEQVTGHYLVRGDGLLDDDMEDEE